MKQVATFLRVREVSPALFPLPSSEVSYVANKTLSDIVIPDHGGELKDDGTWYQNPGKIATTFAQSLPGWASEAGQLYIPSIAINPPDSITVLGDPVLESAAVDDLEDLALNRFDAPWGGVNVDIHPDAGDKDDLDGFLRDLAARASSLGLSFSVSYIGRYFGDGGSSILYYPTLESICDLFLMLCFDHYPASSGLSPHWWTVACIEYTLEQGVSPGKLWLGSPIYCRYWPVTGGGTNYYITYDQAVELVDTYSSTMEWIAEDANGAVNERYAAIDGGHVWIHDAGTLRFKLALIDQYGLGGLSMFVLGVEDNGIWPVIAQWRKRRATRLHLVAAQNGED